MTASDDASFSARLQAIEDRLAIIDLLAGSALSSDVASAEFWQSMFTTDAEMDRGDGLVDRGLEQLLASRSAAPVRPAPLTTAWRTLPRCRTSSSTAIRRSPPAIS
jgi:hypothetical protein